MALGLYVAGLVALLVACAALARWMRRRRAEWEPDESTLTDQERAQAQLGIALSSSTTGLH
jgi:hypothetical protein